MKNVSKEFIEKFKVLVAEAKGLSTAPYWDSTAGSRVERAAEEAEEAFNASNDKITSGENREGV